MSQIVKTNEYRCVEYCPNCPFLDDGKAIQLKEGRVDEIKAGLEDGTYESFTCHKTYYNLDNDMKKTEEQAPKMCYGAYKHLQKVEKPNLMMRLAISMGID